MRRQEFLGVLGGAAATRPVVARAQHVVPAVGFLRSDSHAIRRFVVQDTQIEVVPGVVVPLSMSLNELFTNAGKYGALSNATGCVAARLAR
jgi:hypothetical protein